MRQRLCVKTITGVIYEPCLVTRIFENGPDGTLEVVAEQYNTTLLEVGKICPPLP